jgi:chromosome segregation protein
LRETDLALIASAAGAGARPGTLAAHVRGPAAALALLSQVYVVQSLDEARVMAAGIGAQESVITRAGEWFGLGFARVRRRGGAQAGMLAREREIHALKAQIETLQARVEAHGREIDELKVRKVEAERARDDAQRELYVTHRRVAELAGQPQSRAARSKRRRLAARIEHEAGELESQLAGRADACVRGLRSVARMGDQNSSASVDVERRSLLEAREEARRMRGRRARPRISTHWASNRSVRRSRRSNRRCCACRSADPARSTQGRLRSCFGQQSVERPRS